MLSQGIAPVYPVSRDKVPLVRGGHLSATQNVKKIIAWWEHVFPDANVGVRLDRMTVIDLDSERAELLLVELECKYGELPETRQVKTARGRHLYFRVPSGVELKSSQSQLAEGIDIVGTGQPVIAPPSVHKSGHVYHWLNNPPIAMLPETWTVLIKFHKVLHAA
jgi:Bifunctional DNA primase/polymerase, N-terminal